MKQSSNLVKNLFASLLYFNAFIIINALFNIPTALAANTFTNSTATSSTSEENSGNEFLPPDEAFKLNITVVDAKTLQANFTLVPTYYLYHDRIKFTSKDASITETNLPKGEIKDDPNFGKMEVYHHDFIATINLDKVSGKTITINAGYQGCSEKGLCYAPINKIINVDLPTDISASTSSEPSATPSSEPSAAPSAAKKTAPSSEPKSATSSAPSATTNNAVSEDKASAVLKSGNLLLIVAVFFGAGLLLSLTPCVLPMIPILSSIIIGSKIAASKDKPNSKLFCFGLSLAYVLGMALSYTLAGIAAGLTGNLISNSLQNPWVLSASAVVFVLLAFSMFGFYELKLPNAIENRILNASSRLKGGQFVGVFIMGALSALIVSPCIAAPLAGALIYISQTHNVILGGFALFALAIGMGVPLLLIGASAGTLLPKAGSWMTAVRNLFGVLMLAMAAYIISPVVGPQISNLVGHKKSNVLEFTRIKNVADLDTQLINAHGRTVMLDFYADWCIACKEFEKRTFSNSEVQQSLKNTIAFQADVTANSDDDKALLKRFGLFGPPGIIFFDKQGRELNNLRVIGFQNAEKFLVTTNQLKK